MRQKELIGRLVLAASIGAAVVAIDWVTKRHAARNYRSDPQPVIPGVLTFTFTENPGSAFSLFQGAGPLLGVAAIVAVVVVALALRRPRPVLEVIAFGLIMGGAVGNLVDRVRRGPGLLDGRVIDWIQLPRFPVFNLADSAITVAVALLLISSWRLSRSSEGA